MKASDTEMRDNEVFDLIPGYYDSMKFMWDANPEHKDKTVTFTIAPEYRAIIAKQAEISFKAGIKEVVDSFYGASIHSNPRIQLKVFNETLKKWQTFLKSGELK